MSTRRGLLGLLGLLALTTLPACLWWNEIEVSWDIGGSASPAMCDTYEIGSWVVSAEWLDHDPHPLTAECQGAWQASFVNIDEGIYTISVDAVQKRTGESIARRQVFGVTPKDYDVRRVEVFFRDSDFAPQ